MKYRFLIGASVALATMFGVAEAQAQWLVGPTGPAVWYAGPEGGWTNLEDQKARNVSGFNGTQRFDDGFNVGARLGVELGWWRFEEEYRYQQNKTVSEFGIPVGGVLVNMRIDRSVVKPDTAEFVRNRLAMQDEHMETIWTKFDSQVRSIVPLFEDEVRGVQMLKRLANEVFTSKPTA